MKFLNNFFSKNNHRPISKFLASGFHGDLYLIEVVEYLMNRNVTHFFETGTNVGTTLAYMAKKYPEVPCYSCEPDKNAFTEAVKNTKKHANATIYNELSQNFLLRLENEQAHTFHNKNLFWLDAHGYGFDWPLKEEINFILNNFSNSYILIDDFKVPHLDVFGYDKYNDQTCSFEYIKGTIPDVSYELYYPNYSVKTSEHHPLRGWGLFVTGENDTFEEFSKKANIISTDLI